MTSDPCHVPVLSGSADRFLIKCCFFLVFQGSSTKNYFLQRTLQSLERYFYLIVFNAYLHEQVQDSLMSNISQRISKNLKTPYPKDLCFQRCVCSVWFSIRWHSRSVSADGCALTPGFTAYCPAWTNQSSEPQLISSRKQLESWWAMSMVQSVRRLMSLIFNL